MSDKQLRRKVKSFLLSAKFWWAVILVGSISRLATWFSPVDSDHWIFYYVGKNWFSGGTLYLTAWDHKSPIIFAINGLMHLLFGDSLILHRIFFTLIAVLSVWLFYLTAKHFLRYAGIRNIESSARIATIIFTFWSSLSQFASSGNTTENFGSLFLISSLYCYLRFTENNHFKWILYSGAAISILVSLKINFALLLIPMIVDFIINNYKSVRKFFVYGFIWIAPTLFQIFYWYTYFDSRKMLKEAIIAAFTFNSKYLRAGWAGNISGQLIFIIILSVAVLFFIGFIYQALSNKDRFNRKIFVTNTALSSVVFSVILGTFYGHYYLIVMPYFSLIAAVYWRDVISSKFFITLSAVGILGSYAISLNQFVNFFYGEAKQDAINMQSAADYVKERTTATDKIFYYGYGATFYHLANRDSGSRFISPSHMLLDEREGFGFDLTNKFIGDMAMSRPKYIVVKLSTKNLYDQNTKIKKYIENHYEVETSLEDYQVLIRKK